MFRKFYRKGFSIVEMMVVMGALGGMALVVMQIGKNSSNVQSEVMASSEFNDLKGEVDIVLNGTADCTASLKGVEFQGSTINTSPVEVELWNGDQNNERTRKRYASADPLLSKSGKLVIESIHLKMPDYTAVTNFPVGKSVFKGEIGIRLQKSSLPKNKSFPDISKSIYLNFDTNADGKSVITSCGQSLGSKGIKIIASGDGYDGQTGDAACKAMSAECTYVESTNYMTDATGCTNMGTCIQTCMTFYNNSLAGVVNMNGHDKIHSCDAKIGNFITYQETDGIKCSAYFHAVCNK